MAWRRAALALLIAAAGMAAFTLGLINWLAASAARRADFARASFWRPDSGLYLRIRGERLLAHQPRRAITRLRRSIRWNPENPLTRVDLVTAELAAGDFPAARRIAIAAARNFPHSFRLHWLRANLSLAQGDEADFWRQFHRSCALAADSYYGPMLARALTLPHISPRQVWRQLPRGSLPAAANFLLIARHLHRQAGSRTALARVLRLSRHAGRRQRDYLRSILLGLLRHDLRAQPAEALRIWNGGLAQRLFHGQPKHARGELATAPGFPPGSLQRYAGDAADWLGWFPLGNASTEIRHSTGVTGIVVDMNGLQGSHVELLRQWLLAAPGSAIAIQAESRCLPRRAACGGLNLQLRAAGKAIFTLPLAVSQQWQTTRARLALPAATVKKGELPSDGASGANLPRAARRNLAAYRLLLLYQRPLGEVALDGRFEIRRISVRALSANTAAAARGGRTIPARRGPGRHS